MDAADVTWTPVTGGITIYSTGSGASRYDASIERWYSQEEIAAHFGYTTRWVRNKMTEGMPYRRIGGRPRYRVSECEKWFEGGGI